MQTDGMLSSRGISLKRKSLLKRNLRRKMRMTKEESPIVFMRVSELEFELKMAREAEREACAKVCEDIYNDPKDNNGYDCYYTRPYLECAEAIRERSENARARGNT
jgi:hypothetical protein